MNSDIWRNPRVWIGFAISIGAVAVVLYRVDLSEVGDAFREANYLWLIPGVAFALGTFFLRAVRWRTLFFPLSLPLERLFWIMAIGYTVTTLLPLRLGDLVRAHLVGEVEEESKTRSFTTVAVEHLMDVLTVLAILLLVSPFIPVPGWVRTMMFIAAGIVVGSTVIIVVAQFRRRQSLDTVDAVLRRISNRLADGIRKTMDSAIEGFSALGSPRPALKVVGWSAAQWSLGGFMMWMVLLAFSLPSSLTIAMFMVAMSALALTIPSSPGFIGVYHAVMIEALAGVFDAGRGQAASFAVISHLFLFVPPVVFGGIVFVRDPEMWDRLLRWRSGRFASGEESAREAEVGD
jgi:glycosyltransferase 2 family protein